MLNDEIKSKLKSYLANNFKVISGLPVGIPDKLLQAAKAAENNCITVNVVGCNRIVESGTGKYALLFFSVTYDNQTYELLLPLVTATANTSAVLKLGTYVSKSDGKEREIFNVASVWVQKPDGQNGMRSVDTFTEKEILTATGLS